MSVELGYNHSSALTSLGRLFMWGDNGSGQLGDGRTTTRYTPVNITNQFSLTSGETIASVELGYYHSSALTSLGRLFMWGYNAYGQLGDGTTTSRYTPYTNATRIFDLNHTQTIIYCEAISDYTPIREGYTFSGWYSDANFVNLFDIDVMPAEDLNLYSYWTINEYTIIFDENGGSDVTDITQDYNTQVEAPNNPTRTGYTFGGWFRDSQFTTAYTFTTMEAENIILYAKWD